MMKLIDENTPQIVLICIVKYNDKSKSVKK